MNYVLFSIDKADDTHTLAKFLRHFDTQMAMQKTKGVLVQCIGQWKGKLEVSFLCRLDDYIEHIKPFGFTQDQECIFLISGWDMETFILDFDAEGEMQLEPVGNMVQVTAAEAFANDGFTYRPDIDAYWVLK